MSLNPTSHILSVIGGIALGLAFGVLIGYSIRVSLETKLHPTKGNSPNAPTER